MKYKNNSRNTLQAGIAHLEIIFVGIAVIGLVGVLGFVGYNAWQGQQNTASADYCQERTWQKVIRSHSCVSTLQKSVNAYLKTHKNNGLGQTKPLSINGTYDEATASVVKTIQEHAKEWPGHEGRYENIAVNGTVDPDTWAILENKDLPEQNVAELDESTPNNNTPTNSTFTVASWNSWYDNKLDFKTQIDAMSKKASIIAIQEMHIPAKRKQLTNNVLCKNCDYAGYMYNSKLEGSTPASLPIVWKKSDFSLLKQGYMSAANNVKTFKDCNTKKNATVSSKWVTWVKLKDLKSNQQFYILNTHTGAGVESKGKPVCTPRLNQFKTHMNNLINKTTALKKDKLPIFIAGDFNVNYRYDHKVKNAAFPYSRMGKIGLRSSYELTNLAGVSDSKGTQGANNRIIDYIFSLNHAAVRINSASIDDETFGSDHYPVYTDLTLLSK